nr:MAG TPA: hypothetical protein [Caudoviricetes sp.]
MKSKKANHKPFKTRLKLTYKIKVHAHITKPN